MLRVADFKPHYVVVSLGIDTFLGDPLGDFCLTRRGYSSIGEIIGALQAPTMYSTSPPQRFRALRVRHTLGVRYVMEGGYVVPELGNNVAEVLMGHERSAGI
jgi:acetoin utilization deacetylase AcuC-like enzyme